MRRITYKKILIVLFVMTVGALVYLYSRPVPEIKAAAQQPSAAESQPVALPWPAAGQAAVGASGYGVLAAHNTEQPVSIASIAKVIAAKAVLEQKPLSVGQTGPIITFDSQDVDLYNYYYSNDGSVAKVQAGEQISEYQALQAMLLPSANNMADSLTRWAFGSKEAYTTYANQMVRTMGLSKTTVGGASGFADDTVSTADDLVKLGIVAMANPVIAQIVGQSSATVPVAGEVKNVNWLLGNEGVEGIKTGNTDKAGGCFLFAAKRQINGQTVTVVGAVLGASTRNIAIGATVPLLKTVDTGFETVTPVHKGQVLATYQTPWNTTAQAVAAKDISVMAWKGQTVKLNNQTSSLVTPAASGTSAGVVKVTIGDKSASSDIVLSQPLSAPPWTWRLLH